MNFELAFILGMVIGGILLWITSTKVVRDFVGRCLGI